MQLPRRNFQRKTLHSPDVRAMLVQPGCPDQSCTVSDISDDEARIVLEGETHIPPRFVLALDNDQRWVCELMWWHGRTAGLKFVR